MAQSLTAGSAIAPCMAESASGGPLLRELPVVRFDQAARLVTVGNGARRRALAVFEAGGHRPAPVAAAAAADDAVDAADRDLAAPPGSIKALAATCAMAANRPLLPLL